MSVTVTFTCPRCHTEEQREMPDTPPGSAEPAALYAHLQRHLERAVRSEMREESRDACLQMPPHDLHAERSLCASALAGLRWPAANRLQRKHFFNPFYGLVWELARATEFGTTVERGPKTVTAQVGKPHLPTMAAQFEALRYGEKRQVLKQLRAIDSPWVACACDEATIHRIIELAWQRDLYASAQCLTAMMGSNHPIIGAVGFDDPHTDGRANIRARLLDMLSTLEGGPNGDPVLDAIERVVAASHGDVTSPAQKARSAKFQVHRDLVYQAAAVVGWLKKDDTIHAITDACARVAAYLDRLSATHTALYDIWERLAAMSGAPGVSPGGTGVSPEGSAVRAGRGVNGGPSPSGNGVPGVSPVGTGSPP